MALVEIVTPYQYIITRQFEESINGDFDRQPGKRTKGQENFSPTDACVHSSGDADILSINITSLTLQICQREGAQHKLKCRWSITRSMVYHGNSNGKECDEAIEDAGLSSWYIIISSYKLVIDLCTILINSLSVEIIITMNTCNYHDHYNYHNNYIIIVT